MGLAKVWCRAGAGVDAPLVSVEVHLGGGLPRMNVVGLPEAAVRESKDRVRAALQTSGFEFPQRRITVGLAPADLPKEGGRYDLPIALGILVASGQLPDHCLQDHEFLGELGLDGSLRGVSGLLPAALAASQVGRAMVVPEANAAEAALAGNPRLHAGDHLLAVAGYLKAGEGLARVAGTPAVEPVDPLDLADVRGQHGARRALEVAAAGGHNLLLFGPPGSGKTLLARRMPGILPTLSTDEALASAAVASVAGQPIDIEHWRCRPFRAPHHSASAVALVGGGSVPRPGEISLAHNGVLFLDELPEFERRVLEVLREPLEQGRVVIARAARRAEFPARFQLVAAMNPCPCGWDGDRERLCRCSPDRIRAYRGRLSGPLLDRIDLHVAVPRVPVADLTRGGPGEPSLAVRRRVTAARTLQQRRQGRLNALLEGDELLRRVDLGRPQRGLLETASERLGLTARATHRVLRMARTVADLDGHDQVLERHLSEALQYRRLGLRDEGPGLH